MKRLALTLATLATLFSLTLGTTGAARAAGPLQMNVPILMIHRTACTDPFGNFDGNFICPERLDAQMALLKQRGWQTITADQLAADFRNGVCPGFKTFVITVDDGALDGYENGAPIWEKYGYRASFAMVTGKAGDYLQDPPPSWYSPAKPHFSWDQARDLIARGHDVINHTVMHTPVRNDTPTQLDAEVGQAQRDINRELGYTPDVFVYPYGSFGTAEQPYLLANFVLSLTDPGSNGATNGADENPLDAMHAPRIRVSRSTTPDGLATALKPYRVPC